MMVQCVFSSASSRAEALSSTASGSTFLLGMSKRCMSGSDATVRLSHTAPNIRQQQQEPQQESRLNFSICDCSRCSSGMRPSSSSTKAHRARCLTGPSNTSRWATPSTYPVVMPSICATVVVLSHRPSFFPRSFPLPLYCSSISGGACLGCVQLQRAFGISHECFASPLNVSSTSQTFNSLFVDVDKV